MRKTATGRGKQKAYDAEAGKRVITIPAENLKNFRGLFDISKLNEECRAFDKTIGEKKKAFELYERLKKERVRMLNEKFEQQKQAEELLKKVTDRLMSVETIFEPLMSRSMEGPLSEEQDAVLAGYGQTREKLKAEKEKLTTTLKNIKNELSVLESKK